MDELNIFLDFVFKYYEADCNNLSLDQDALKKLKKHHPKTDEFVCKLVGQVRLTTHNILSSLLVIFLHIDHEFIRKKNVDLLNFYDFLKIMIKPEFKINGEQIPFDFLYELLNMEKNYNEFLNQKDILISKDFEDVEPKIEHRKSSTSQKTNQKQVKELEEEFLPYPLADNLQEIVEKASIQSVSNDSIIYNDIGFIQPQWSAPLEKAKTQAKFQSIFSDQYLSEKNSPETKINSSAFQLSIRENKEPLSSQIFEICSSNSSKNESEITEIETFSSKTSLDEIFQLNETDEINRKSQTSFLESINKNLVTNYPENLNRDYKSEFVPVQPILMNEKYSIDPSAKAQLDKRIFGKLKNLSFS